MTMVFLSFSLSLIIFEFYFFTFLLLQFIFIVFIMCDNFLFLLFSLFQIYFITIFIVIFTCRLGSDSPHPIATAIDRAGPSQHHSKLTQHNNKPRNEPEPGHRRRHSLS
jgi:hypothetical protein